MKNISTVKIINNYKLTFCFFIFLIFLANYFKLLHNKVILLNIFLIIIGIFLFEKTKKIGYLFLFLLFFIFNEILFLSLNIDFYNSHDRTELFYSGPSIGDKSLLKYLFTNESISNIDSNFTEGIFPDNKYLSLKDSEKQRFDLFIDILNIKPNDLVLDAGCGNGNLVEYLRSKNIDAYGITITKYQYDNNKKKYGNHYYFGDYTEFNNNLLNKFDHIILPGSLEHPFGGNLLNNNTSKNKSKKMENMFNMFSKYFKNDSDQKKILTTCIHSHSPNNKLFSTLKNKFILYCTERMFGGCYPTYGEYSVANSLKKANYKILTEEDRSYDYYLSSYYNKKHFGNPMNIPLTVLIFFPLNQFLLHNIIYWKNGFWMWMWSNRLHYERDKNENVCNPNKSCDLYFEEDFNKRPCSLLYTVAQLNK